VHAPLISLIVLPSRASGVAACVTFKLALKAESL
jgi:hypothetical protein